MFHVGKDSSPLSVTNCRMDEISLSNREELSPLISPVGAIATVDLSRFDLFQFGRFFWPTSRGIFFLIPISSTSLMKKLLLEIHTNNHFLAQSVLKKSPKFDLMSKNDEKWIWKRIGRAKSTGLPILARGVFSSTVCALRKEFRLGHRRTILFYVICIYETERWYP